MFREPESDAESSAEREVKVLEACQLFHVRERNRGEEENLWEIGVHVCYGVD